MTYLLDTNIVSYILKKNTTIDNKLRELTLLGQEVFVSCSSYYEIKRGLILVSNDADLLRVQDIVVENWLREPF